MNELNNHTEFCRRRNGCLKILRRHAVFIFRLLFESFITGVASRCSAECKAGDLYSGTTKFHKKYRTMIEHKTNGGSKCLMV